MWTAFTTTTRITKVEASKKRDVPPEDFEAPEITIDTSVAAEEGSPANPAVEEEATAEESSDGGEEESPEEAEAE